MTEFKSLNELMQMRVDKLKGVEIAWYIGILLAPFTFGISLGIVTAYHICMLGEIKAEFCDEINLYEQYVDSPILKEFEKEFDYLAGQLGYGYK